MLGSSERLPNPSEAKCHLGTARYSSDAVFRGNYMGPAAVRFEGLTVTGA